MGLYNLNAHILEKTTPTIEFQITDEDGVGFKPTTMTLTLYDEDTGQTINARNGQNVLDTNDVATDAQGNTIWAMQVADNAMINSDKDLEVHVALFNYTWSGGVKSEYHQIKFAVKNLEKVT